MKDLLWRVVNLLLQAGIKFFIFPLYRKIITPVCSTVPASLQARGRRPRDCNKGKGRAKKEGDFFTLVKHEKINSSLLKWVNIFLFDYQRKEKESNEGNLIIKGKKKRAMRET